MWPTSLVSLLLKAGRADGCGYMQGPELPWCRDMPRDTLLPPAFGDT